MRSSMSSRTSRSRLSAGSRESNDLQRPADARERVLDLVRHHRRHLPELGQGLPLPQTRLGVLALRDLVVNRHVLVRLAPGVEKGHDRRIDPVDGAVSGAVPDFAVPDPSRRDRAPQVPKEIRSVIPGVDDAMVLAEELLARVLRDLAELVVDRGDGAAEVGRRDDRRLIERELHVAELLQEPLATLPALLAVGDVQAREDHAGHHAVRQADRRRVPRDQPLAAQPADDGALEVAHRLVARQGPIEERSDAAPDGRGHERVEPVRPQDVGLVTTEQLAAGPVDVRHPPPVAQGQQHGLRHVEVVVELDGHEDRRHASSDATHGPAILGAQAWKRIHIDGVSC